MKLAMRPRVLLRGAAGIAACAVLLWTLLPPPRAIVETLYSRGLYRAVASIVVPAVDLVPFSVSFASLGALGVGLPFIFWRSWRAGRRADSTARRILLGWLEGAAMAFIFSYALFLFVWGAGYQRERLQDSLGLAGAEASLDDVRRWVAGLLAGIERDDPPPGERDGVAALDSLRRSLASFVEEREGVSPALPRRVKRLPAGSLLSWGTSGVTVPFFLEPHVDGAEPEAIFLFIAAHELAHVAGYCGEADADLAAAISGLRADHPYARYAVSLLLFGKFIADLPVGERVEAVLKLPPAAREDRQAARSAAARHRIERLARAQDAVYNAYLRSHGVKDGMREYSFVVRLLVAAEKKGIVEVPR